MNNTTRSQCVPTQHAITTAQIVRLVTHSRHTTVDTGHADPTAMPPATGSRPRTSRPSLRALALTLAVATALGCAASDTTPPPSAPTGAETTITPAADPVVYPSATVTYLHYQTWTVDLAITDTRAGLTTYDEQIWWHPDCTALTKRCPRSEPPDRDRIANPEPETGPCPETARYGTGSFTTPITEPLGTDPETMRRQLAPYQTGNGDQHMLRAVAALYRDHHLNPQQRAAVLHVLDDLPSLRYHGETTDRASRKGMAFTVDSGDTSTGRTRDVIILDADNGVLLSYEQIALTPPPGQPLTPMTVTTYIVYLDSRVVTTIPGTPATSCDETPCTR